MVSMGVWAAGKEAGSRATLITKMKAGEGFILEASFPARSILHHHCLASPGVVLQGSLSHSSVWEYFCGLEINLAFPPSSEARDVPCNVAVKAGKIRLQANFTFPLLY